MQDVAVFISYRRVDASADAGRLYDALRRRYSRDSLFMDVDSIRPGQDWIEAIDGAVSRADVFLALIGAHWLDARDDKGNRRLDNELDPVRLEIEAAIRQGKPIIPVVFGSARMPTADELPPSLLPLVRHHAVFISHASFEADMRPLFRALRTLTEQKAAAAGAAAVAVAQPRAKKQSATQRPAAPPPQKSPGGFSIGLVAGAVAVLVALAVLAKFGLDMVAATSPTATPSPSATLAAVVPTPTTKPSMTLAPTPTDALNCPAPAPAETAAAMQEPPNYSVLAGSTVVFRWCPGAPLASVFWYSILIGSSPGASDIAPGLIQTVQCTSVLVCPTELTATGLPTDGRTIYIQLYTQFLPSEGGGHLTSDYTFYAAGIGVTPSPSALVAAKMTSPSRSQPLPGSSVTFSWYAATGATVGYYDIQIAYSVPYDQCPNGQQCKVDNDVCEGIGPAFNQQADPPTATSMTINDLPTNSRPLYVRLFTQFGGDGGVCMWHDYTYTAAGP